MSSPGERFCSCSFIVCAKCIFFLAFQRCLQYTEYAKKRPYNEVRNSSIGHMRLFLFFGKITELHDSFFSFVTFLL